MYVYYLPLLYRLSFKCKLVGLICTVTYNNDHHSICFLHGGNTRLAGISMNGAMLLETMFGKVKCFKGEEGN